MLARLLALALFATGLALLTVGATGVWQRQLAQQHDLRELASPSQPASEDGDGVNVQARLRSDPGLRQGRREGDLLGRVWCPARGFEASIRAGVGGAQLDVAAGHVPGTALPGRAGNSVVVGHRDSVFAGLARVETGDEIRLAALGAGEERRYRVSELRVVDPDDLSVLAPTQDERLTLITCYPFRWIGPAPQRYVVTAVPIDG